MPLFFAVVIWLGLSRVGRSLAKEQDKTVMARLGQGAHEEVWAEAFRGPHTIATYQMLTNRSFLQCLALQVHQRNDLGPCSFHSSTPKLVIFMACSHSAKLL